MGQPDTFEKQARVRVGGGAVEGGRWHGRLIGLVVLLGAALLITLIVSASLDPTPAPTPTAVPTATPTATPDIAALVAWVQQRDSITRWDASGGAQVEGECRRCAAIGRPGQPPLFASIQASGAMAIYDPLDRSTTVLDHAGGGLIPPPLLSPDGQRLALRTFDARGQPTLRLADLATGTTRTALDQAALSAADGWLLEYAQLQMWDDQYLYALSANWGRQVLWRIDLDSAAAGAQLAPEILLDLPTTSVLAIDPVFGWTAYITPTVGGGPELRVRNLDSASADQAIASDVYELSPISPDGTQLVYRRIRPAADSTQLVLYNLNTGEQRVLADESSAATSAIQWSQRGDYLMLLYPPPDSAALIFRLGEHTPVARVALDPLTVAADMSSGAAFVALSYANERYYLTIETWLAPDSRRVIPLGAEPATLVYVP